VAFSNGCGAADSRARRSHGDRFGHLERGDQQGGGSVAADEAKAKAGLTRVRRSSIPTAWCWTLRERGSQSKDDDPRRWVSSARRVGSDVPVRTRCVVIDLSETTQYQISRDATRLSCLWNRSPRRATWGGGKI